MNDGKQDFCKMNCLQRMLTLYYNLNYLIPASPPLTKVISMASDISSTNHSIIHSKFTDIIILIFDICNVITLF